MKMCMCGLMGLTLLVSFRSHGQAYEVQQLLLDVEKLAQFKQILQDLKTGYQIIYRGYTTIKDLSEGNFSLHKTFLDGLLQVSPAVRNYKRISDIVSLQLKLVSEYKAALKRFRASKKLSEEELRYLQRVYASLFSHSLQNLDALTGIITAGEMRMSDAERLTAIDQIHADMTNQFSFLKQFNSQTTLLILARLRESGEARWLQLLYGDKETQNLPR